MQSMAMAFGTMTSRVLGLIRDMAFASLFSRTVTDAWGVAFRLPNMFRRLLGEGSLSVSFIPVFIDAKTADATGQNAKNLVNSFYTVLLLVLGGLTAMGIIWAEPVCRLLVDSVYEDVPGKLALTVRMAQIMFGFIFLMSSYAFFMGILNAFGKFALAATAPTLFNLSMIVANFIPREWQQVEGDALAWGVLVGGFLQAGVLIPGLVKLGYFPKISKNLNYPGVAKVWRNMIPGMLGMGLLQITTIVNTNFASSLGEGSNTYIYLADRLLELPLSLVAVSLGTALLPTLARLWSEKKSDEMGSTSNFYLRVNLLIALPAALGLYFLSLPIVELLFERGSFTRADSLQTAAVVSVYALTLIVSSSVRVIVPAFYAIKNTWLPAVISAVCLVAHLLIAPYLMGEFGLRGLVTSTLLSATLNLILLLIFFRVFIGSLHFLRSFQSLLKMLVGCGGVIGVIYLYQMVRTTLGDSSGAKIGSLILIIGLSGIVYFSLLRLLKSEEAHFVMNSVFGRISRRLKRRSMTP